ncbi:protease 2-like isoform X2 [Schistocerca gregaria]|nr:protease 2-like isoform X2 [Schistocerca gregaria]
MAFDKSAQRYMVHEDTYAARQIHEQLSPIANMFRHEVHSLATSKFECVPEKIGDYYYYTRQTANSMTVYCRKKLSLDAPEEVLLDCNTLLKKSNRITVGTLKVTQDHRFLVYLLDTRSNEMFDAYVMDTVEKTQISVIKNVSNVEWALDGKSIFYSVPDEMRRPYRIYRRYLHGKVEDELIHEELDDKFFLDISRTKDWKYIIINSNSKITSEVRILDTSASDARPKLITARNTGTEFFMDHAGDYFYIVTNEKDSNYKVMRVPDHSILDLQKWEVLVPSRADVSIEDVDVLSNHVVIYERHGGLSRVCVINTSTREEVLIPLESGLCHIEPGTNLDPDTSRLRFTYSSPIVPGVVYDYHFDTGVLEERYRHQLPCSEGAKSAFNPENYQIQRVMVPSTDGVQVPMTLVHRKGIAPSMDNLTLLHVYGAYGHSLNLDFDIANIPMLQRGWMIAYAHVRGGGELGRQWHAGGKLLNKRNSFDDFISCTKWLISNRYTQPKWIAAKAASAGGMVLGVAANEAPELYKAMVMKVPFLDVLSSMLNEHLPLTVHEYEEWGNPNVKDDFENIYSYDPYWNIQSHEYPAMFITSSMLDIRVPPWNHSRYVAKLRSTKKGNSLILLRMDNQYGHFGNGTAQGRVDETVTELAFIYSTLNVLPERI